MAKNGGKPEKEGTGHQESAAVDALDNAAAIGGALERSRRKKKNKKEKKKPETLVLAVGENGVEKAMVAALESGEAARVRELAADLHHADIADILERVAPAQRPALVEALGDEVGAEVISELDETVREDVLVEMDAEAIAQVVQYLDSDDAVGLVDDIEDDAMRREVLDAIPDVDRSLIEESLTYPEESAGRLMQRELVTVPTFWTVGETIDFMRRATDLAVDDAAPSELPSVFYDIYVVDPSHRPVGKIALSKLLRTRRPVAVADLMTADIERINVETDQEDVAFLFRQRDLVSAPVVDGGGRLVGSITIDDVVDVIHKEHEEDILRMAGVADDDLYSAILATTRSRFSWLAVNLLTAVLASLVIGVFEATLEQAVALAVLMPIVASMGGNAGTQSLTVAVRALATRELTATNASRVIVKELVVGGVNGVIFAVLTGVVAWVWFGDPVIGWVIALAMIVNMLVAGLAGASIPLMLDRHGVDPAVASSVFLTTVTDVVGFFAFLGLAALILF